MQFAQSRKDSMKSSQVYQWENETTYLTHESHRSPSLLENKQAIDWNQVK
jgi:hypothetical protein